MHDDTAMPDGDTENGMGIGGKIAVVVVILIAAGVAGAVIVMKRKRKKSSRIWKTILWIWMKKMEIISHQMRQKIQMIRNRRGSL